MAEHTPDAMNRLRELEEQIARRVADVRVFVPADLNDAVLQARRETGMTYDAANGRFLPWKEAAK